jgi:VWFA-related protein
MVRLFRVLLISLVSTSCLGGSIVYLRVHRGVLEERLKAPPDAGVERVAQLRTLFEAAGCTPNQLSEQAVPKQDLPNVMCNLPGKEPGTIVVGAPIDSDPDGKAEASPWPTLALLPLLAESLGPVPHRFSLTLVAFTGHGRRGSSEYLKLLTESQRQGIQAMVSLEDLGRTPPVYALAQEDRRLANWLTLASNTLRQHSVPTEITARNVDALLINGTPRFDAGDYLVDARSFQRAHIPAIALRSAPASMIPGMRRAGAWPDSISGAALDLDVYEQTYNQLCTYVLYLDSNLGTIHSSPPGTAVAVAATPTGPAIAAESPAALGTGSRTGESRAAVRNAEGVTAATAPSTPTPPNGQEQAANPSSIPVFHARAQLVVMDVSVTDRQGMPLKSLKASDFTLLEDGKPQQVRVFEAHGTPVGREEKSVEAALPARTFSNRPAAAAADPSLSILLFDLLNTPPQDQAYARAQMLQFLKAMPRGKHLALFVLGTHLQMVQGFTDDPEALVKTAEKVVREASPLLTTEAQQQQDQGFTEEIGRHAQPSMPSGVPAAAAAAARAAQADAQGAIGFVAQRTATSASMEGIRTDQRATLTLDALGAIARTVSAYPGRKNLVWLSSSFQIRLRPSNNTLLSVSSRTSQAASPVSDLSTTSSYQEVIRSVTTMMATARIAVYPIDVRGVRTSGVDIGVGADQSRSAVDPGNNDAYNKTLSAQSDSRFGERSSMLDLADQTGGRVFAGNDVRGAIARSLDEGSNYYTLAYTPEKNNNDHGFRRVEIKVSRESVKLAYRPGYYPTGTEDSLKQSGAHALAAAMQPGLPESTMLLVTARVLPPDATNKALRIDYSIDFSGLDFTDTPDSRKRALLDCMAVALDRRGQVAGQVANTMDAALPPNEYMAFQRTGLPLHQELVLPPGTYDLRLGVLDRASQKIGTVNVPVEISAEKAVN